MEVHFNGYKVRYEILDRYFKPVFTSNNISTMNIFINLDDFFHMLHRPLIDEEFQNAGVSAAKQFVSNVLNLMAHYKHWAIRYYKIDVKVYAIYTSNIRSFKNSLYTQEYRRKFREYNDPQNTAYFFINNTIQDAIKIFTTISQYIPDIYVVDSKYLEPSCIPLFIGEKVNVADWNMLITRDTYDLQYAYKDKWTVLRPKGDNSSVLHRGNIWNYINEREHVYRDNDIDIQYNPSLFVYAKAIVGDTYRSVPRLRRIGWKTLFKILDNLSCSYDENTSPVVLKEELVKLLKDKKVTDEEFEANIHAIDVDLQVGLIMNIDSIVITSQLIDRMDYNALNKLNQEVFIRFPLRLDFLTDMNIKKIPFK